jgi:glycosyltransferase involved in cell wall biosynthesis
VTGAVPSFSVVVPAYNASDTIEATLRSVFDHRDRYQGRVEVIVVDDGSADGDALAQVLSRHAGVRLEHHAVNRGMCAARNTGLMASTGAIVTILDADDTLTPDWPEELARLVAEWPGTAGVCWAGCRNVDGAPTVPDPTYSGLLTKADLLAERRSGEYLPMFRGDFIRPRGYIDLGTRKSCGLLSYLSLASETPFWVSSRVLRIYDDRRVGSVTSNWARPDKARESAICLETVLNRFGAEYREVSAPVYGGKQLRLAVYRKLAGMDGAWKAFSLGYRFASLKETLGTFAMLVLGRTFCLAAVDLARRIGAVRRYG